MKHAIERLTRWMRLTLMPAALPRGAVLRLAPARAMAPEDSALPEGGLDSALDSAIDSAPDTAPPLPVVFGLRRPLLAAGGPVAGFEFRLPPAEDSPPRQPADPLADEANAVALLAALRPTLEAGRVALARLPAEVLTHEAVIEQAPIDAMLLAEDLDPSSPEQRAALGALRRQGVRIGVPARLDAMGQPDEAGDEADFVVLTPGDDGTERLLELARTWLAARPGATLVATDIPSIDELESVLRVGVAYAAGCLDAAGPAPDDRPMQAGAQRLGRMLNDLVLDRDTALVAEAIRADVALSYRMLRYVNSPVLGLARTVDSIEQAVALIGRGELYRWLCVLLLTAADGRKSSRALQEIALSRARLLELLARERGSDPPDALFTVGLLSLLDVMLQAPLARVLEPLHLGDAAREALLERAGPWQPYLALAVALEQHDSGALDTLAAAHGGVERVLALADEAWGWAAQVGAAAQG